MTDAAGLIVIAQSARALASSARRAGYAPLTIDMFGDDDTRALSRYSMTLEGGLSNGIGRAPLIDSIRSLVRRFDAIGVVYGSGFEHQPELIAELACEIHVYGAGARTLARAKDPREVALFCASSNVKHPEISFEQPADPDGWLVKSQGGAGGQHVRFATQGTATAVRDYWQRRVEGRSVSALFVADGGSAEIVGLSEQWTAPSSCSPFRYGGAVGPIMVDGIRRGAIEKAVAGVTRAFGIVGIASVDFIVSDDAAWLIEVNPRPGATLDVFDCDDHPLLARHLEASDGRMTAPAAKQLTPTAAEVVYARRDIVCRSPPRWPDWVADRPGGGSRIAVGDPICTVLAAASDTASARRLVATRAQEINAMVEGWTT
jgi:predicted ATP-grasp superfamily ATP-dependent carboligase